MSTVTGLLVAIGGLVALGIAAAAAFVTWKNGAAKGWRETAEAFKARSEEQALVIAEQGQAIADASEKIVRLREEVSSARERIAVLEDRPDLSVVVAALTALTEAEAVRHDDHEQRALSRHEAIVSALTAVEMRIRGT